ncbi:MAG: SLOG family protein [Polyangiaceae bacterium]
MRIVVVTGSRNWADRAAIERVLAGADALIVGDCPTGADAIALEVARAWDIIPHVHRADWERFPKAAGPMRNENIARDAASERAHHMFVECHAFPLGESRGTRNCIDELRRQGFEVVIHEPGGG